MQFYTLFKNGEYVSPEEQPRKFKYKKGEVKAFLIQCWHPVFGTFYVAEKYDTFRKIKKNMKESIVTYRFMDGIAVDLEEEEYLFVKNKYWYYNQSDLFAKMMEIYINENIFNDSFWVYDSFFQYIYDNVKIKCKIKNKKKKTYHGYEFFRKFITADTKKIIKQDVINMKNNSYSLSSIKKAKSSCFVQLYPNVYFEVKSKIFKFGTYNIKSQIYLIDDNPENNYILNERYIKGKTDNIRDLSKLLETYVSKKVIRKLESSVEGRDIYKVVNNRVRFKKNKKKYKFSKFIHKYFIEII